MNDDGVERTENGEWGRRSTLLREFCSNDWACNRYVSIGVKATIFGYQDHRLGNVLIIRVTASS